MQQPYDNEPDPENTSDEYNKGFKDGIILTLCVLVMFVILIGVVAMGLW